MRYILNDSVMLHESKEDGILISVTGNEIISISDKEDVVLEIFKVFTTPRTFDEAYNVACSEEFILENAFQECFEFMCINNLLKEYDNLESLGDYRDEKYKRQISSLGALPGIERNDAMLMQKKICNSCVCILGIGGTGSHLALAMTSIGVEKIILVDFDTIELSNTTRQILYDESDVGRLKVDVAKEKLHKYNSKTEIITKNVLIESSESLNFLKNYNINLLILCADTPRGEIHYIVESAAEKYKIPWFCYGPYNHSHITIGPLFLTGKGKTYSELYPHDISSVSEKVNFINKKFVAAICDPYNGFASHFAAIESFKFLTGYIKSSIINRKYYIHTDTWEMEYMDYD